jgi:glutathione S-transferase
MTYILWGSPHSLYTGKIRSYLIKKGVPYRERCPSDPDFAAHIGPKVGLAVIPVLETPQGELIQDSGAMIARLEEYLPEPQVEPVTPVQKLVSLLFDAFGSEHLLPTAMHYRWSYRAEQEEFLRAEFGRTMKADVGRAERREAAARTMSFFNGFLPNLGVFPETAPAIEAAYLDMIEALDEHFQWHPYLLGGRPSCADFGMMAPLFAHLGRDPVPAGIMKAKAPNLFRWTERMNSAPITDGEYPNYDDRYTESDTVPETLEAVMKIVFADWLPGLIVDARCFNDWSADKPKGEIVSGSGKRQVHPNIGSVEFPWRGITYRRGSQPHMLWMLAAAQEHYRAMTPADRACAGALLSRTGGSDVLALKLNRSMERQANVLVLAD